jgi:phage gpG-like protein
MAIEKDLGWLLRRVENTQVALLKAAADTAIELFKENFEKEGFQRGSGVDNWDEVKRRELHEVKYVTKGGKEKTKMVPRGKGKDGMRKILSGRTGLLKRNFRSEAVGDTGIRIINDTVYAGCHNEGLRAGRGKGFVMPKRQFMGESEELDKRILRVINEMLGKI